MSVRTFIFCDRCNPQGIRNINRRNRSTDENKGRRNSDGRAWFEGSIEEGIELGWSINAQEEDLCPSCVKKCMSKVLNDQTSIENFNHNI